MNNSECFVALVSSIHQIELTALVMLKAAGLLKAEDEILVLVDNEAQVPAVPLNRIKSPRLAFPTPIMVLEARDKYRQIFAPTIPNQPETNLTALRLSAEAWVNALKDKADTNSVVHIRNRAKRLVGAVTHSAASPGTLTGAVIQYILHDFLGNPVSVQDYSTFVISKRAQRASQDALLAIAREILSEQRSGPFKFRKGGYIDCVVEVDQAQRHVRFDHGTATEAGLCLVAEDGPAKLIISFHSPQVRLIMGRQLEALSAIQIICRGPLVMAFLTRLGIPVDVPWYYETVTADTAWEPSAACAGLELISPISVAAPERTADRVGGGGLRLLPSGYSFLEYQHPIAHILTSSLAQLSECDNFCFDDWQDLIANYPWRRQKALKDQGGVSEYCQRRLHAMRQSLKSGSPSLIEAMTNSIKGISPTEFGKLGLQLLTLLRYARDTVFSPNIRWSGAQLTALEHAKLLGDQGFDYSTMYLWICSLINSSRRWRNSVTNVSTLYQSGGAEDMLATWLPQIPEIYNAELATSDFNDHSHRQVWLELQSEVFMYYRASLAVSSCLLKAHAFSAWLLFGPETFLDACNQLIQERGHVSYLWLRARLWKSTST